MSFSIAQSHCFTPAIKKIASDTGKSAALALLLGAVALPLTYSPSAQAADSALTAQQQAQMAPMTELKLPDVNGGKKSLADFKGQVVLVDFWASWCGPCRQSFPWMNQLQSRYADQGLNVVAINLDEDPAAAREFLSDVPAQFTVLLDSGAQLPGEYGVMGMPSSYLIDRDGKIRAQHIGFHSDRVADYESRIQTLLAQ